ncbi:MAG TPA: ABC transporter permease [Candidatus Limnocylindrales bacterium]|nr:ABC transporter permease [Candidatus Limnocylindrales bacterium]
MSAIATELMSDVSYGLRQIRRNLSASLLCILVLALGIGSATAVFAALYDVLLKPPPYRDADRIVFVHNEFPGSQLGHTSASPPDYADLTAHREIFGDTAAYYFNDFTLSNTGDAGYAQHVDAVNVSGSFFPMLGIAPQMGRAIRADDDRYGAAKVAVLSDALWRSRFNGDSQVVGRTIDLDGQPHQVIGVMPPHFDFPYPATQMWVPLALPPADFANGERGDKWLDMLARLAPGVTLERARAMLATVSHHMAQQFPDAYTESSGWHFSIEPMLVERTKDVRQWLLLAFGSVICVLLIACTNVSGLLLVRATVRSREWAVRAALGASTSRMIRQILTETATLAAIGCAAGIALAMGLVRLINVYGPVHHIQIEPWTLAFAAGLCAASTIIAGLLPAAFSSRTPIEETLRAGTGRSATGRSRWRAVLVSGQIALAVALFFTAAGLGRSFAKLLAVSPGFSAERVWSACITLPSTHYADGPSRARFFRTLNDRVAALPGVESASAGVALPFSSGGYTADLYFPERPVPEVRPAARVNIVLPVYFETLRIPLIKGRTFTEQDDATQTPSAQVVVIDEIFARRYFPGQDPIGKLVANNCCHDHPARIIGVVGNVATKELAAPPRPEIYWPELQLPNSAMFLVVRQAGRTDVTAAVREILHKQDASVALFDIEPMPERILDSLKVRRFVAWLLNMFALAGAALAAFGLYGTLAYLVQLRRREIAIRIALGATAGDVAGLVARYSASLVLGGVLPGAVLCFLAARATGRFLFGVTSYDAWTIAMTAFGLLLLGIIATWAPVAQAVRENALGSLREE